jgi:DNA-binding MarR family transcriptional regulator
VSQIRREGRKLVPARPRARKTQTVAAEDCASARLLLDLPQELADRLDFWAVCVLRAVAEQPWLTGGELAPRAGVDPVQISRLLTLLVELGLVDSVRDAHRKGTPKAWRITDRGRELDNAIGREAPAPARNAALDLMWKSGGRVSEPAIAVLRVSAAEPGLSNGAIAERAQITDANTMSQLLARLAWRGLMKNVRNGGRENVWVLTVAGTALERALREEAPAPASQTVAFALLTEAGGRLTDRVVSALSAIGLEPGLSVRHEARSDRRRSSRNGHGTNAAAARQ